MTDTIGDLFTGIEAQKREQINSLMSEWKSQIAGSKGKTNTWGKNENPEEYFVSLERLLFFSGLAAAPA
jgi:hypothetical protein